MTSFVDWPLDCTEPKVEYYGLIGHKITPLHLAAYHGRSLEVIEVLLPTMNDKSPKAKDRFGNKISAMEMATKKGHDKIAKYLCGYFCGCNLDVCLRINL